MINTYITIYTMDIIALIFLFGLLYSNNMMNDHRKRSFSYGIVFTILVILSEIGTILASGASAELRSFNILCNVLGFALTPIVPIVLTDIFDVNILKKYKLLLLPTILNGAAAMLSPLFGLIFYIDANNHYERGNVFFLFVIVYIVNIIFLVAIILYTARKNLYSIKWRIAGLTFFTVIGTCIQLLNPKVHSSWHCVALSLFLLYIILSEFDGSFDTLTMLNNRASFEKASRKIKAKKMFAIIAIDINNFKEVNDTFGHDYGDIVLKEVAAIIRNSFDNSCNCYRIGGDEFYIICKDTNQKKLDYQLRCMRNSLAKERQNDKFLPTVAYGYSIFQGGEILNFKKILKAADDQMYYCKQSQKNGVFKLTSGK